MGFLNRIKSQRSNSKENISVPSIKRVYGYEVRKMATGRWLEARDMIANLPLHLIESLFPDMDIEEAVDMVIKLMDKKDYASLLTLASEFILTAPEIVVNLVSHCINEPVNKILEDENLGIDGLIKLVVAIVEVNKLGEVVADMKELLRKKEINE